jgi:hypothetical protein
VEKGEPVAFVADPAGDSEVVLEAPFSGVVIGRTNLPLVFEGEATFHLGRAREANLLESHLNALQSGVDLSPPELIEEPAIV